MLKTAANPGGLPIEVFDQLRAGLSADLFYKLMSEHLYDMLPVIYDPTVAIAIEHYSLDYRRPLSIDHPEQIEESFRKFGAGPNDIDLLVATDAEEILGLGDWGVGDIGISVGKLAVYTAAAGIDPARVIPVMLDVGTNRESLLNDPLYIGNRHARVRGERYDAFIDAYVKTATRLFLKALLHWEDFGPSNARRILEKYRHQMCTFMAAHTQRPIIFPLSNPTQLMEASASDLITWTDGRALVATGIPSHPVTYQGTTYVIEGPNGIDKLLHMQVPDASPVIGPVLLCAS